ncbi:protein-disulfide reductase DsbD domain-containing protein [Ferrovibrio sp.]|uniref:protein-disulfide reductase DsbD family protein n=1 Tax=Ferrovibrio sp. TaxID=1917215 RepID=UPI001B48C8FB|nr:protein-disulfide reductase DsbD domain-containing protein [Ferrovibrio sp.]MBP7066283.1 thioredoxin family protein [Ferrovibrio sp.]
MSHRSLLFVFALLLLPFMAAAQPVITEYSEAELITERSSIAPGETIQAGLRLKHREHWHSYWRNPGDSGLPTELTWKLPPGWQASAINWPAPQRFIIQGLANYGYEGEFVLPVMLTAPVDARPGETVPVLAQASWLVCENICVPEEVELSVVLPVQAAPGSVDPRWSRLFETAAQAQPRPSPWAAKVDGDAERLRLFVAATGLEAGRFSDVFFYADDGNAVQHAAAQPAHFSPDGLTLEVQRGIDRGKPVAALSGVLVLTEKLDDGMIVRQAFAIAAAPGIVPAVAGGTAMALPAAVDISAWEAVLLAMLGGLILNIMPCVFPILFMKALAFARLGQAERGAVRREGLAYTAGVLATFAALAAALLILRAGGAAIGWGYQLQSPAVVLALAYLMALIGFNLAGLFEIRLSANLGGGLAGRGGSAGAFFTGALAVLVATPCTAPFMGAALGFALTAPAPLALAVFLALGLGMALPFLLFSLAPGLARFLPRPGAWMTTFRQALAFPMFATAAWLIWVLAQQAGPDAMLAGLFGMLLLGFGAWALGHAERRVWIGRGIAMLAVIGALLLLRVPQEAGGAQAGSVSDKAMPGPGRSAVQWAAFDAARIAEARGKGQPVLVNMTAAWCVTCLVNEGAALSSETVAARLRERGVLALKGDWTRRDPAITRYLGSYGRSGVPLYVLYPADPAAAPVLLPQLLTESIVLDALNKL